jgi:16S rRNA (cytidine1402-2'-O)-methyltransferase
MNLVSGVLYVVATPLGNLADMTPRAIETLKAVDLIAAEDTRHSGRLLQHFGIKNRLVSLHEHNEEQRAERLIDQLLSGQSIALISDAGTPLISDPGYRLVEAVRAVGIQVVPVPGASAIITALSVSGLPTDRFSFEGFLPAKRQGRARRLSELSREPQTLVFYESCHRIRDCVEDMVVAFGKDRYAVIARELTKAHEQVHGACLGELLAWLDADPNHLKGEFVVLVHGAVSEQGVADELDAEAMRTLELLMTELPIKQAAKLTARRYDLPSRMVYQAGLELREKKG